MNNYFKRLLSMIVAATMIISSFSSAFAGNFVVSAGTDEVVSGSAIDIASFSSDPISEEAVFAPDRDAYVSDYELPALVTGYYSMNKITLLASDSQSASIDTGWYSYEDGSYEYAARTLSPSSDLGGVIAFATEGAAKVKVNAVAQASDSLIGIIEGMPYATVTGEDMIASQTGVPGVPTTYEFSVLMGGQYAVAATAGFDFSEVVVTPLAEDDLVISGEVEDALIQANALSGTLATGTYTLNTDTLGTDGSLVNGLYASSFSGEWARLNKNDRYLQIAPSVNGSVTINKLNSNRTLTVDDGTTSITVDSVDSKHTFDVEAGKTYTVTINSATTLTANNTLVYTATEGGDDPATTVDATVTVTPSGSGTATITGDGLTDNGSGSYTLTINNEYTVTATAETGFELDSIMVGTTDITDSKTFTAETDTTEITVTFKATTVVPIEKEYVTINTQDIITETGGTATYTFTGSADAGKYIATGASNDRIYAMTDTETNYVILDSTNGLMIVDGDSASNAAYIPYGSTIPTSGTLTISGTVGVTASNTINILRFSGATGIRQDGGRVYISTDGTTANNQGSGFAYTPGEDLTFEFTINVATGEASLSINGETAQTATGCSIGTAFPGVVFNTGSSAIFNNFVKNLTMTYTPAAQVVKVTKNITLSGESQTVTLTNAADSSDVVTLTASGDVQLTSGATYNVTVPAGYTVSPTQIIGNTNAETITVSAESTVDDGYAMMGTYKFGRNASKGDYNFTDEGTQGNVTVANVYGIESSQFKLRSGSNSTIKFKLQYETYVTIENTASSSGNSLVATNDLTGETYTFPGNATTKLTLLAGSYTITAINNSNCNIATMILEPTNASTTPCTITGKVVDGNGVPVEGATILLNGSATGVTTADDGSYTINVNVYTDTTYRVSATMAGYNSASVNVTTGSEENASNAANDIILGWAGTITANVTLDGEAVSGITVNIDDGAGNSATATTNGNGVASFASVAPGTYTVTADGYTQTATAEVAIGNNPTVDLALETVRYSVTINVINSSNAERTLVLTAPNGTTSSYLVPTEGAIIEDVLAAGTWLTSCAGATVSMNSFTVNSENQAIGLTLGEIEGSLIPISADGGVNGLYDFSVGNYDQYFRADGAEMVSGYYEIVYGENDALYFDISGGTKNVEFTFSYKDIKLEKLSADGTTWEVFDTLVRPTAQASLTAGSYRITAASGTSGLRLNSVQVLEEDDTSATLTLNVTNNTSDTITVSVAGSTSEAQTVAAGATTALTFAALGTGDHAITVTGTGTFKASLDKVTVAKGEDAISATMTVDTAVATKVTFAWDTTTSGDNASPDKSVSISGAGSGSLNTSADSLSFENITPGEVFYFESESTKVTSLSKAKVVSGETITVNTDSDPMQIGFDQSSNRRFVFEVPDEENLASEYIIYFVTSNDYNTPANGDNHTSDESVTYNQYGFGGDKYYLCGNNGRTHLTYVSNAACIRDFNNGYSDANSGKFADYILNGSKFMATTVGTSGGTVTEERWRDYGYVLINSSGNSYIEFTTGEIEANTRLLIDSSLVGASGTKYTVTPNDGSALSSQGTSGSKDIYYIQPNTTYKIVGGNSSVSTYIKSIRTFNPNNIFNKAVGSNGDVTATPYQAGNINGDLLDALNISSGETRAVLRLIGEVAPSNVQEVEGSLSSALNDIKSVGWKVMPKAPVDAFNTQHSKFTFTPEQWSSMTENVGGIDYTDDKNTLQTWFERTSNEFDTTELINTGVMKLTTDANPSATSYDDVHYVNHTSEITSDDLLIGDIDATKPDKAYTVAYSERFITLPDGDYYIFPYTVYSIGSDAEVYSQVPTSVTASQENWKTYTRVVEVHVSGGVATVIG